MNCTLCNKPIVLVPSAKARAATDITGKSADYYTKLFTTHSRCSIKKRNQDTTDLINKIKESRNDIRTIKTV